MIRNENWIDNNYHDLFIINLDLDFYFLNFKFNN